MIDVNAINAMYKNRYEKYLEYASKARKIGARGLARYFEDLAIDDFMDMLKLNQFYDDELRPDSERKEVYNSASYMKMLDDQHMILEKDLKSYKEMIAKTIAENDIRGRKYLEYEFTEQQKQDNDIKRIFEQVKLGQQDLKIVSDLDKKLHKENEEKAKKGYKYKNDFLGDTQEY